VIQQSERGVPFSRPHCLSGSRKPTQNIIVRSEACAEDDGLSAFLSARARLFGIAYRILKSAAEAEDILQDVWIRWQLTDRSAVRGAAAFLAATTTRLAINVMQSARWRRETTVGPSLQESVDSSADPKLEAERSEALQSAVFVLLEKLSPAERAAYVLREAFDYSYREIANIVRVQEANARQLVTRARQRVAEGRHAGVNSAEQRRSRRALSQHSSLFWSAAPTVRLERASRCYGLGRRSSSPLRCLGRAGPCCHGLLRKWHNPAECHKSMECSVIASTTGRAKCLVENEGDNHGHHYGERWHDNLLQGLGNGTTRGFQPWLAS